MRSKRICALLTSLALAASSLASMAFVMNPGTGSTTLTDAFSVTGITLTDSSVLSTGPRTYVGLVDLSKKDYNTNELMYYGINITVNNPVKTLAHTSAVGNEYVLQVTSSTSDLSINTATNVVLTHPYEGAVGTIVTGENGAVKANATDALTYDAATNTLSFKLKVWNDSPGKANVNSGYEAFNLAIDETSSLSSVHYTIGFTAVNRTDKDGALTLKVSPTEYKFNGNTVTVAINGRTYKVEKVAATWPKASNTANWPQTVADSLSTTGYKVSLVNAANQATEIVTLDTEVTNAEGYGVSLGIAKGGKMVVKAAIGNSYVYANDGTAAFTDAELAAFNTMLADFGFSTAYNYKLQDKNFEQATTYKATFTIEYNKVDNEADVEEPTPDEDPDDEIIEDDELDGDIPIEDDDEIEVPITSDPAPAAALCLALAAAGACALFLTLKRAK